MMLRVSSPLCGSRVEYALDAVFISVEKTDSHQNHAPSLTDVRLE